MNETRKLTLTAHILAIAMLPLISIALTLVLLVVALNHLDETRKDQKVRREAIQHLAIALPDRMGNSFWNPTRTEDPAQRRPQFVENLRKLWLETFTLAEECRLSEPTKEKLHHLERMFGTTDGCYVQLNWLQAIGAREVAPQRWAEANGLAERCIGEQPPMLRSLLEAMEDEINEGKAALQWKKELRWIAAIGFIATLLSSIASVTLFSRGVNRRLAVLGENARRMGAEESLLEPLAGSDEIAMLDRNFHDMNKSLKEARHEEQAAIKNSADVICALDQSLNVVDINPACKSVLGYEQQQLIGKNATHFISDELLQAKIAELKKSTELSQVETTLRTADGASYEALLSGYYSPEQKSLFCVIHNITVRKDIERLVAQAEARERVLMEHIPAGLITFDNTGEVIASNRRACELVDVQSLDSAFYTDLRNRAMDRVCTISRGERTLQVTLRKVNEQFLAVLLDQTEREQFKQMRERFLSMIAHDIATPLTNIGASFYLYGVGAHGELNESGLKKVHAAEVESHRLVRLFKDLLRAEQHTDVPLEIGSEPVNLKDLLEQAVEGLASEAERREVQILLEARDCPVRVDSDRIVQVFVNLLNNALKFSPTGSTIRVSTIIQANVVRVQVADEGPGIPEEMMEAIFEPFKQVSVEDATVRGGSGLGLAICKLIVTNHGGGISVRNAVEGAIFTVDLPCVDF